MKSIARNDDICRWTKIQTKRSTDESFLSDFARSFIWYLVLSTRNKCLRGVIFERDETFGHIRTGCTTTNSPN